MIEIEVARLRQECPDCEQDVLECDNGVRLDAKADPSGEWGLMPLGTMVFAAGGNVGAGSRFNLHAHQPPEH